MSAVVVSLADYRKPDPVPPGSLAGIIAWLGPAPDWWTGMMEMDYQAADYRRILTGRKSRRATSMPKP